MANGEITGPPSVDFYNMLSGMGENIKNNAKLQREQGLRDAFKDGLPKGDDGHIDFGATGNILSQHGADLPTLLTVAKLAEEQRKSRDELKASSDFRGGLSGIFGNPPASGAPPSTLPPATPPQAGARPPVMPTAKVWGDKEAEDAGLYEPKPSMVSFGDALGRKPPPTIQTAGVKQPSDPSAIPPQPMQSPPQAPQIPTSLPTQPTPSTGFQGIGIQHAPSLIAAMANPRLPSGDRELAGTLLKRALDDAKEPDKIRTLTALKEQSGYPGTILQLEMEMRKAGKTDVNIDQRGENEEAKAAGKAAGERRASMFAASDNATKGLAGLTRVQTLLDQVDQGKLQPSRMTIGAWAKSLGVNDEFAKSLGLDPAKVGTAQALQAMTNELVLGKIGAGGFPANNFSDADRQFLTDTLPKLGNDARGNKIMIEGMRRVHQDNIQRSLDYHTWKEDPANKGRGFEDFELSRAKKTSQMDRFGDLRKQAETILGTPATTGNAGGINWSIQ